MNGLEPPSDADLAQINALLDWHAGTLLPDGRLLGRLARRPGKRTEPGAIPDDRITLLNKLIPLQGKRVLELGCFEGIHTVGLLRYCDDVTALDVRPSNVVKTLTRLSWHGHSAKVFQKDVEKLDASIGRFDVVFHFGVLYHLADPVTHLTKLAGVGDSLFLDTHVAGDDADLREIAVEGRQYRGIERTEGGWSDPFSGKSAKSFWLTESSLVDVLKLAGFGSVQFIQRRAERNGPRVLLLAQRADGSQRLQESA